MESLSGAVVEGEAPGGPGDPQADRTNAKEMSTPSPVADCLGPRSGRFPTEFDPVLRWRCGGRSILPGSKRRSTPSSVVFGDRRRLRRMVAGVRRSG